jgi:hypothetical protein
MLGAIIEIDEQTGHALSIERFSQRYDPPEPPAPAQPAPPAPNKPA